MKRYILGGFEEVFFPQIWKSCDIVKNTGLKAMIYPHTNSSSATYYLCDLIKSLNLPKDQHLHL